MDLEMDMCRKYDRSRSKQDWTANIWESRNRHTFVGKRFVERKKWIDYNEVDW